MDKVTHWMGRRPSLPYGLPVLGTAPKFANAFCAFGNSHFGMSARPVTGRTVAELIAGRKPQIDIVAFDPRRIG